MRRREFIALLGGAVDGAASSLLFKEEAPCDL